MPTSSASQRRYLFAVCSCRPSLPFRGKQISAHQKQNPEHSISKRLRVCLADLQILHDNATEDEVAAFKDKHASCPGGQVSSRKSKEFFASVEVSDYFRARQERQNELAPFDDDEYISDSESDNEMEEAVTNILAGAAEAPPDGIPQVMEPPATQPWTDWRTLWSAATPHPDQPGSPGFPPSPQLPQEEDLADLFEASPPRASTSTATLTEPPAGPPVEPPAQPTKTPPPVAVVHPSVDLDEQTPILLTGADWLKHSNQALQSRVNSLTADNQRLGNQLQNWKRRADSIRRREAELQKREQNVQHNEALQVSTEQVLVEARRKLEGDRSTFQTEREEARKTLATERSAWEKEKETWAAEKDKITAARKALHAKDVELQKIAAKLKRMEARQQEGAATVTSLHIPLAGNAIVADPRTEACQISAGEGCGHLQLKAANGHIEVVSYHSVAYSKRPPTTHLYQEPAKKPRQ